MKNQENTLEELAKYIHASDDEKAAIDILKTMKK